MKRILYYISVLTGGALLLAGCEGDTITLEADPVVPEATTLRVSSENPLYSAQDGSVRFKTPGGEVEFAVETNADAWSCTNSNETWLSVEQNEYDGTLTLRVERNEEASEPKAEVVITAGEGAGAKTQKISVTQNAAGTPEIVATPNQLTIAACGSVLTASTEIACNYEDWEFTQSCSWMLVERKENKLVFTAEENASPEPRQVEVKLSAGYGDKSVCETIVVAQDGKAFVKALPEALSFDYRGGTKTIAVSSNFEWSYKSDAGWFTVTREGDVLTVTADPYEGEQGQTKNIELTTGTGENTDVLQVAVSQMGVNDKYLRWVFEIPSDNVTATAIIAGEVDAEINWGDGTVEPVTKANPTHTYATAGSYNVEVSGKATALNALKSSYLTEIIQWGQTGLTSMANAFTGCKFLKTVPSDMAHSFDEVTTFAHVFESCETLGAIPEGLFDNAVKATDFTAAFFNCFLISKIPEKLFYYNTEATTFYQTFYSTGTPTSSATTGVLTAIPAGLFEKNVKAENFLGTFGYTAIRSIPATLFQNCPAAQNMQALFDGCALLEIVPADLFGGCPNVTNFMRVFAKCTNLKSVPELLFFNNMYATTFKNAFSGAGLETIPAGLFANQALVENCFGIFMETPISAIPRGLFAKMTRCTDFSSAFKKCTGLRSIPSDLLSACAAAEKVESLFEGCMGITSVPTGLLANTTSVTSVSTMFSGCESLASIPTGLFAKISAPKNANSVFKGCIAIESVPADVFSTFVNATTFTSTFEGCTNLKSLPAGLFDANVNATGFSNTFKNCTGLKSLPDNLFSKQTAIKTFSSTFSGCSGLESLPESLFEGCTSMTSVSSAFLGCSSLKTLPENLFATNPALETITSAFSGCSGLESLPAGLFDNNKKLKTVKMAFKDCVSLTGESPYTTLDDNKIHLYERTTALGFVAITNTNATDIFAGCTGLSDYDAMPAVWK